MNKMKNAILYLYIMIGAVLGSTIVKHPTDTTGTIGGVAKFVCEVDFGKQIPTVTWLFNDLIIYFYMDDQVDYPVGTNKYVVSNSHTIFTLEVRNLSYTDGGNYFCKVLGQEKSAALIVLGSPVITHEPSNFTEETKATYICGARLGGPSIDTILPDQQPQLELFLDDVMLQAKSNTTNANSIQKVYEILLDDSMDTKILKCVIGTTESKQKLTSSTSVKVLYSVRNITYSPQEDKYEFGSNITCSARGNPIPLFEWKNIDNDKTGIAIKDKLLHITDEMDGKNSWTCIARNSFNGKIHEDEITATFEAVSIILQDEAGFKPEVFLIAVGCLGAGIIGLLAYRRGTAVLIKFKKSNVTGWFYVTAVATVIGSSFPHGWSMGVLNIPQTFIKKFIDESFTERYGYKPSSDQLEMLWAVCVSIYLISGCFGILTAGKLQDWLGSKRALLFCYPFEILAAILFGLCKFANSFEMLIVGRLIIGFFCGAGSRLVLMYLSDIAPRTIENEVLMLDWFGITFGILLSQIAGLRHCLGTDSLWPYMLSLTVLPSVVSLFILPMCPRWPMDELFKHKRKTRDEQKKEMKRDKLGDKNDEFYKNAEEAFKKFDNDTFEEYYKRYMKKQKVSERDLFQQEWEVLSPCRILLFGLNICQRLSGIYIVFYYSLSLFEASGVPQDIIEYCVLTTGVINVLTTGASIVGDFKHRRLLLIGMSIMIMSSLLMTLAFHMQIFYISIISINTFVLGFALGFGPRTPAITIAHSCNWFVNFIVVLVYPVLHLRAGPNSFWIFTCFLVISIVFVFAKLPETNDKSMRELYEEQLGIKVDKNWPIDDEPGKETNEPEEKSLLDQEANSDTNTTKKFEEVPMLEIKEHNQPEEATTQPELSAGGYQ